MMRKRAKRLMAAVLAAVLMTGSALVNPAQAAQVQQPSGSSTAEASATQNSQTGTDKTITNSTVTSGSTLYRKGAAVTTPTAVSGAVMGADWAEPEVTGSYEPTLKAPAVQEFAQVSTGQSVEDNLYTLTVATGTKAGNNVHYFAIRYVDSNNVAQTQYIFPRVDAISKGAVYIEEKGDNSVIENRHKIVGQMGYEENELKDMVGLKSWSVDEFLFKAGTGIK